MRDSDLRQQISFQAIGGTDATLGSTLEGHHCTKSTWENLQGISLTRRMLRHGMMQGGEKGQPCDLFPFLNDCG